VKAERVRLASRVRRHRRGRDDLGDDFVAGEFLRLGLVGEADAVAEHVRCELLNERRTNEILPAQPRKGAASLKERERGTG
jgi:hypothetical protein